MELGFLFTLGYAEVLGPDDLRQMLEWCDIDTIVDVRLQPWGRAPFNGPRAARATVEAVGLRYLHLRDLGNVLYKSDGIQILNIEAIEIVLTMLRAGHGVALMCACPRPEGCHRRFLAEEAVRREPGLHVIHVT
jgi:uncharacterized protein (DUF488 family)